MIDRMAILPIAIGLACCLQACRTDLGERRIGNAVIVLLGLCGLWATLPADLPAHLAACLVLLVLGIPFWLGGWCGGGDVKLLAVGGLWSGPEALSELLLVTALAGGVLAVAALKSEGRLLPHAPPPPAATARPAPTALAATAPRPRATLPYGVAIVAGIIGAVGTGW